MHGALEKNKKLILKSIPHVVTRIQKKDDHVNRDDSGEDYGHDLVSPQGDTYTRSPQGWHKM